MNYGPLILAASLAALLLASLPGKSGQADQAIFAPLAGRAALEDRAVALLADHGFRPVDRADLSLDGNYRVIDLRGDDCAGKARVAAVPINGEASEMLDSVRGAEDRLFYVYGGETHGAPPVVRAHIGEIATYLLHGLNLSSRAPVRVFLAVVEPAGCGDLSALPWSGL